MDLTTPLTGPLLKTTRDFIAALEAMNINTVQDLLLYLPRSHEDLSTMQTIATAPLSEKVSIRGTVDEVKLVFTRTKKRLVTARFTDSEGGIVRAVWFNQPHIKRMLPEGSEVVFTGKIVEDGTKVTFQSPTFELLRDKPLVHSGRLVPVYPQHDIISTRWLREKMALIKDVVALLPEVLPEDVVASEKLLSRADAVRALHFPEKPEEVQQARDRMAFEEMYRMQEAALVRKAEWQSDRQERLKTGMNVELIRALFASLKFTPTESQRIAIFEILRDMEKDQPMSRLLEGDVGSGKTLVAVAVMANAVAAGGQCALMVPTEVLARQHADVIGRTLIQFHKFIQNNPAVPFRLPSVALLTGSVPTSEANAIKQAAASGTTDILIGTHALIEDNVRFKDLRLVIVDEQHRFGVSQRARLKEKGSPHFLSMTATPIPRTLALTAYGEHDLSVLLEKPGRRQVIQTKVVAPKDRVVVERFIEAEIEAGRQVFVICPLITESEELDDVKNVQQESERLRQEFPRRRIAMLHGKLASEEKQRIMQDFRARTSDILVSTSVIEVGIDIPNASIIVIEGAERFGLAQLHQLRGRVGRGDHKSHCFLFTTTAEQARSLRLKAMEKHDSGFLLAEIDLKLRGPGEIFGLRQSGMPEGIFSMLLDPALVLRARRAVEKKMGIASGRMV